MKRLRDRGERRATRGAASLAFLTLLTGSTVAFGQGTLVPIPPHSSTYNGFSRGFNFTANTTFMISRLELPPEAMQPGDTAGFLVRINGGVALRSVGNAQAHIDPMILINTGDVVDIIGNWSPAVTGDFSAHNSYAPSGIVNTTIEGVAHELRRTGWQWDIADPSWESGTYLAPGTGQPGRVFMYTLPPSQDPAGCCFADGTCQLLTPVECANQGGTFRGIGSDCSTQCPQPGACCFPIGACEVQLEAACISGGGTWQGANTDCTVNPCPQPPEGACCLPSGTCEVMWETGCLDQSGIYYGDGTNCTGRECPFVQVLPNLPHAASNSFPFNMTPGTTMHQVYASTIFDPYSGGAPIAIERIAFAPTTTGTLTADVVIRLGYTNAIPGQTSASGGLAVPDIGGGGAPNAIGTMHEFFNSPVSIATTANAEDFSLSFTGPAFDYDPAQGNLLMEIYLTNITSGISISRCAGGPEASRAYHRHSGATGELSTQAHRTQFSFSLGASGCYANCDGSTVEPILNVDDFTCFINEFAAAQALPHEQQVAAYPNCDGSTVAPALNVDDFTCFINEFAAGCP